MNLIKTNKPIVFIIVMALFLRLININQSLWLDEASTASVAGSTLSNYFSNFAPGDFHPPLYYVLSVLFAKVLGTSEIAIRSLSAIAGVITVWFSYMIGKKVQDKKAGYLVALFTATSGLLIYYSQEARMYMLATMFVAGSVHFFINKRFYLFSLFISLVFLTHYVAVFILPVFWIWAVLTRKKRRWWIKFIASHIPLAVLGLLWAPTFARQFSAGLGVEESSSIWWSILGQTSIKEIALVPAKFMFGRITVDNNFLYALVTAIVGISYASIILHRPLRGNPLKVDIEGKSFVIWLWFIVPTVLTALLGLRIPVFNYFRLLFVVPAMFILLGIGISRLKKYSGLAVGFVLVVNLTSSGMYLFNQNNHREDWRGLVKKVHEESDGKSQVLFVSNSQMEAYAYYLSKEIDVATRCFGCQNQIVPAVFPKKVDYTSDTIWLMRYVQPIFDPEDKVRQKIESAGYEKVSEHDFNGVVVWRYEQN